eukprot:11197557-Lingulodinium_polyedra.AAC.1
MASWTQRYHRWPRSCLARACSSRRASSARLSSSAAAAGSRHRAGPMRVRSISSASRRVASMTWVARQGMGPGPA